MKTIAEYDVQLPEYSLTYLINDDSSGLTDIDKKVIDFYMENFYIEANKNHGDVIVDIMTDENDNSEGYFTWNPAFGLPCTCYDAKIIILE